MSAVTPLVKPAPKPRTPMSDEAKERARARARVWYAEHKDTADQRNAKWAAENPVAIKAISKRATAKVRDKAILAAPVIHDADRFEWIAAVMASYKERKGEQQ